VSRHVDINALRTSLRDPKVIAKNSFSILKQISELVNENEEAQLSIEMVLRALEFRKQFGPMASILDALTRRVGLFPYADPADLSIRDLLAYEYHRPLTYDEDVIFHRVQGQVYRYLISGENVILSAPTSFGKSKIIDALVATRKFKNIAVVVPTLALIDETRRRLSRFGGQYKIITHLSQQPAEANLFILTAERAVAFEKLPKIDFFVIDEFYKLGAHDDGDRMVSLNEAFYKLKKGGGQFYLLGPNIEKIPHGAEGTLKARWIQTDYHTVVSEQIRVSKKGTAIQRLIDLCKNLDEPTIIFCASPKSVNDVTTALLEAGVGIDSPAMKSAAQWIGANFHPDWVLTHSLIKGIGIHHGRLPRSLAQMVVREFNGEKLRFLVCTSTLIEGVNTKAKNVIIYDNKIARRDVDFFTFNNISGRAGRMFEHFVGHVYLFSDPPQADLPFVDLPMLTQGKNTPTSLLVQIDSADLKPEAAKRIAPFESQDVLPIDIIRKNSAVDPQAQLDLARILASMTKAEANQLAWTSFPQYKELEVVCKLIWTNFVPQNHHATIRSASQLTFKLSQLRNMQDIRTRVDGELTGQYAAKSVNEAVERILSFDRTWASFEFPRYLMALSRIQEHVFTQRNLPVGNYALYAGQLESLFCAPVLGALDEYGIPPAVGKKLLGILKTKDDLDMALTVLSQLNIPKLNLSAFEASLVEEAKAGLGMKG